MVCDVRTELGCGVAVDGQNDKVAAVELAVFGDFLGGLALVAVGEDSRPVGNARSVFVVELSEFGNDDVARIVRFGGNASGSGAGN